MVHAPDDVSSASATAQVLASFKELDLACGVVKGSAFRAFKALADQLTEGVDFHCYDVRLAAATHAELMQAGRIYAGTINAVLLAARAQALITAHLRAATTRRS
jgi:hypothetical protein